MPQKMIELLSCWSYCPSGVIAEREREQRAWLAKAAQVIKQHGWSNQRHGVWCTLCIDWSQVDISYTTFYLIHIPCQTDWQLPDKQERQKHLVGTS
jgi:hypothetical protein